MNFDKENLSEQDQEDLDSLKQEIAEYDAELLTISQRMAIISDNSEWQILCDKSYDVKKLKATAQKELGTIVKTGMRF